MKVAFSTLHIQMYICFYLVTSNAFIAKINEMMMLMMLMTILFLQLRSLQQSCCWCWLCNVHCIANPIFQIERRFQNQLPPTHPDSQQGNGNILSWLWNECCLLDDFVALFFTGLLDHVTVLIGISMQGKPIGGVIHQPFFGYQDTGASDLGRTMWAVSGLGTFGFKHSPPPAGRRIITTTRSHSNKSVIEAIEAMKPDQVIRAGGAGYKVILLLEGTADGYIFASPGCKRWDTCACEAVLEGVGGKLTDVFGNRIKYELADSYMNKSGVIASLKEHNLYLDLIPESVKSKLKWIK